MKCPHCEMETSDNMSTCEWCGQDVSFVSSDSQDIYQPQTPIPPPSGSGGGETDTLQPGPDMIGDFVVESEAPVSDAPQTITPEGLDVGEVALGIDLGTTNSVAAIYLDGKAEVINVEGHTLVPSVVSFKDARTMLVGMQAKRRAEIDPENTIRSIKRKMGDSQYTVSIHGQRLTPPQISSFILRKLKDAAQKYLGTPIKKAIISVPAYFTSNQREDTRKAGEMAGLEVLRLLPEPTAAAIAYGLERKRDQTIMVYDLGGGTFDVSILKVIGTDFEVLAISGDHDLGGDDFDRSITNYLIDAFKKEEKINLIGSSGKVKPQDKRKAFQILMEASEKAKKDLSEAEVSYVDIPDLVPGHHLSTELTQDAFNDMIRPMIEGTGAQIDDALKQANLSKHDIDRVVLVGGSTIIPLVKQFVASRLRDPYVADNVMQTVAAGAAIMAYSMTNVGVLEEDDDKSVGKLHEIAAHSMGVGLLDPGKDQMYTEHLIERRAKLPAEKTIPTTNVEANQTEIHYPVFQGESRVCEQNVKLGEFIISGIAPGPPNHAHINVTLRLNEDDILEGFARNERSGYQTQPVTFRIQR